jgi:hypothetical protein
VTVLAALGPGTALHETVAIALGLLGTWTLAPLVRSPPGTISLVSGVLSMGLLDAVVPAVRVCGMPLMADTLRSVVSNARAHDVDLHLLAALFFQSRAHGFDLLATRPNNGPGCRGVNGERHTIGLVALDINLSDCGIGIALLYKRAEPHILLVLIVLGHHLPP